GGGGGGVGFFVFWGGVGEKGGKKKSGGGDGKGDVSSWFWWGGGWEWLEGANGCWRGVVGKTKLEKVNGKVGAWRWARKGGAECEGG
ncbi:hypothetical protein ACX0FF_15680, partial [Enterococcus faecium]